MSIIHPTAIVDPRAEIESDVEIGPYTIIEGPVRIGRGCKVGSNCRLCGDLVMGENNILFHGVVLGEIPQHLAYDPASRTGVRIGNKNTFREYATVHRAFEPDHDTILGDENYLMCSSHVGHDAILHNHVILVNGVLLGGHTEVFDGAILSGNAMVHQFTRVGEYCMISGASRIVMDVPPFCTICANNAMVGLNSVGLRRNGFDSAARKAIKEAYRLYFQTMMTKEEVLKEYDEKFKDVAVVQRIAEFMRTTKRGVTRKFGNNSDD